ncbi:ATP-binding protein [Streptomyces sp. CA-250714]|uniref:ATP-binding protein n=1 Tax=Streptomyces sp. CA-250714 TaxID=3240060 RepID=UPI003D93C997
MFNAPIGSLPVGDPPHAPLKDFTTDHVEGRAGFQAEWILPRQQRTPSQAREQTRRALVAWGDVSEDAADAAELIVSELVTNAVVHTRSPSVQVQLRLDAESIFVMVRDQGSAPMEPLNISTSGSAQSEDGRGLFLIDQTATSWGSRRLNTGTLVWARLDRSLSLQGMAA